MVNIIQFNKIKQGVRAWNKWREKNNYKIQPNLSGANLRNAKLSRANLIKADLCGAILIKADLRWAKLSEADLNEANLCGAKLCQAKINGAKLSGANLNGAKLCEANLIRTDLSWARLNGADLIKVKLKGANIIEADLRMANLRDADIVEANLSGANLSGANLSRTDFRGANLSKANLSRTNLSRTNLGGANLFGANLIYASLIETNFEKANLADSKIYGISAWNLNLQKAIQTDLIITRPEETTITVDNLEVAQFVYLLLNNEKIRQVIDTISRKVVLILGRFGKHKAILDAIRNELRKNNYLPILFDFEKPDNRDMTETVRTLAYLARFIIADITEPRSIPQELQAIVPDLAVPVQPLLQESSTGEYAMFQDLRKKYHWVLATYKYKDITYLLDSLEENVIVPAEAKAQELEKM